ncbi:MAG: hypothetical protein K2Y21_04045 [Phycisphaerales bacterium]|nr:hypothetical protein [Phycisphaerales bacterium]
MKPPSTNAHLRLHRDEPAHREEARRLMQAVLDGEISEEAPRLQELLRLDPVLSAEFDELQKLEMLLTQRPAAVDLSDRVLAELRVRQAQRVAPRLSPFFGGLAASVAIGSMLVWGMIGRSGSPSPSTMPTLATAGLNTGLAVGAPSVSAEERLIEDARLAIQQTTGRSLRERSEGKREPTNLALGQPNDLADQVDQATRLAIADRAVVHEPVASASGDAVAISRAGITFVNPGPSRTPVAKLANDPMLGQPVGGSDWQPGATRRRDNVRFLVSGWHDSDGNTVPVTNTKR